MPAQELLALKAAGAVVSVQWCRPWSIAQAQVNDPTFTLKQEVPVKLQRAIWEEEGVKGHKNR